MSQLRESLRKWQSPPNPAINHILAGDSQHEGTAKWLIDNDEFRKWMAAGALLWIHGIRTFVSFVTCDPGGSQGPHVLQRAPGRASYGPPLLKFVVSGNLLSSNSFAIINDVMKLCKAGLASMAYFYFDFRDDDKKYRHNLLSSLLVQLSTCSDTFCDVLTRYYVAHDNGGRQASDKDMTQCLKEMLTLPEQGPVYLIMDALDECPHTSDVPSAREEVLDLVKELVSLQLPGLHICVTSRLEVDISDALGLLVSQTVSLQDSLGQKEDIADYVRSIFKDRSRIFMKRCGNEDKEYVIETLLERADGMYER